ncbi:hypothetical protein BOX15_Mlig028374g3 [Macrostomum lignano]|uniref:Uncharacterized protein n=1 Tax=Macrostomum lignano TaxID=282301 RepID=A0A267H7G2_9PLAT|nr:hypothetical protein BOX15_Mlig028374g3 [Macrostomum lignano]
MSNSSGQQRQPPHNEFAEPQFSDLDMMITRKLVSLVEWSNPICLVLLPLLIVGIFLSVTVDIFLMCLSPPPQQQLPTSCHNSHQASNDNACQADKAD